MRDHVIVCGLGQVGFRVAHMLLSLGEAVTVVTLESRPYWLREIKELGAVVILGDARDESRLLEANIQTAKAFIACADQDLVNLEVSLDARRLAPDIRLVARLFDQNLAGRLEDSLGIDRALAMSVLAAPAFAAAAFGEEVLGSFVLDSKVFLIGRFEVLEQSALAGLAVHEIANRYNLSTLYHERAQEGIGDVVVPGDKIKLVGANEAFGEVAPRSYLAVKKATLARTSLQKFVHALDPRHVVRFLGLVIKNVSLPLKTAFLLIFCLTAISIAVFSLGMKLPLVDALYFVITTVTTTGYGDITPRYEADWLKVYASLLMVLGSAGIALIYSIITDYIVTNRFQQFVGRQRIPEGEHVIVVGLGNVGYRTVAELERIDARVVGIDVDASASLLEGIRSKTPVVIGDARETEALQRAGIEKAAAVIAVTSSDAVNLSVALLAHRLNPKARTVVRTFDADLARKVEMSLDIDVAMSASQLAAPTFVAAALYGDVVSAFEARGRLFILSAVRAKDEWVGLPIREIHRTESDRVLFRVGQSGEPEAVSDLDRVVSSHDILLLLVERMLHPDPTPPVQ